MTVKLEEIYLMNVALFFPTYREIVRFISINKKCFNSVKGLKRNPYFDGTESLTSYIKRFTPQTMDFASKYTFMKKTIQGVEKIQNPSFVVESEEDKLLLESLVPKIDSISLYESDSAFHNYVMNNPHKLTHLTKVKGCLKVILQFFKNYTNEGKEKYMKFPQSIIITSCEGKSLNVSDQIIDDILKLKSMVSMYEQTKIICLFGTHVNTEYGEELLNKLKGIDYYFQNYSNHPSPIHFNKYFNFRHHLLMNDFPSDKYNEVISNSQLDKVMCGYNDEVQSLEETGYWNAPEVVQSLTMICFQMVRNQLPMNTEYLNLLKIVDSSEMKLFNNFKLLKHLTLISCQNLEIQTSPIIQEINIGSSNNIILHIGSSDVRKITMFYSNNCLFKGSINSLKTLTIVSSFSLTFPFVKFNDVNVLIEESNRIYFKDVDDVSQCPIDGVSLNEFNSYMSKFLYYPDVPLVDDPNLFVMRRFLIGEETNIIIENNEVKKIKYELGKINAIFSRHFYVAPRIGETIEPKNKYMKIINEKNETIKVPATIRYFEVTVKGFNVISLGIASSDYDFRSDKHIGWYPYSIGYHSDDGCLYEGKGYGREYDQPYGLSEDETHVIGVGYDTKRKELFYTRDGRKTTPIKVNWGSISVGIGISEMETLEINYGQKPFTFDLQRELKSKGYLKSCIIV